MVFLRKLTAGGASRSFGVEVAKLAGLPPAVVDRARAILRTLESDAGPAAGRTCRGPVAPAEAEAPAQLGCSRRRPAAAGRRRTGALAELIVAR